MWKQSLMMVNEVITILAFTVIGGALTFIVIAECKLTVLKRLKNKLKYGKEEHEEKSEQTKKAGRINARGKW